jgi:glyoxylase-like metal-dependent hydrolase (beta-lactamase superfamily II)
MRVYPPLKMIELHRQVYLVPGEKDARFPYCNGLYLRGKKLRVLIDAGMGESAVRACRREGLDLLILSHCHIDHRLSAGLIPEVPVWAHELEAPYLGDHNYFVKSVGFDRGGFDLEKIFPGLQVPLLQVQKKIAAGERLDLGGLTLEVLHTPGHTPGHLAFFIPEVGILFTADIDLTPFGPFYGHDFADIEDFIQSIRSLKKVRATLMATGHGGPFIDQTGDRLSAFEAVIYQRDRLVLKELSEPRPLEFFLGRNLFYPHYPEPQFLIRWFEQVHLEKQLERLVRVGTLIQDAGFYRRA